MNQFEKFRLERKTEHRYWILRFKTGCTKIRNDRRKINIVLIYIAVMILLWMVQPWRYFWQNDDIFSVMQRVGIGQLFPVLSLAGLFFLIVFFGTPKGWKNVQNNLRRIGMVNHAGEAPYLVTRYADSNHSRIAVLEFETCGIPLIEWKDKQEKLEAALNVYIAKMEQGSTNRRVLLYTVPVGFQISKILYWKDSYLSSKDFELVLGESVLGPVMVDLSRIPHILLGGSTGSGKSILLKLLLMQCVKKGAKVAVADFKGGVDFPEIWHKKCRMILDKDELLNYLTDLVNELEHRKKIFRAYGCADINEYNKQRYEFYSRIIFTCDEVAELLDKNGLNKEEKDFVYKVENKLSIIARQGRAFGIHLILATQRPDATILTGQIRNNIDCRICGRADSILSQIILDNGDASNRIPKGAQGRFLMHDGTIFQGYLFDQKSL